VIVLVAVEAAWRAWRNTSPGVWASRLQALLLLVLAATIAGGLGLLAGGGRPHELLHLVYAVVVVGAVPMADSFFRRAAPRPRGIASLAGALVAIVVVARLSGTG
jgi:hypothetical protein